MVKSEMIGFAMRNEIHVLIAVVNGEEKKGADEDGKERRIA